MKIIRKNDEFKKMPDKTVADIVKINIMIKDGWAFSPKKDYKESKGRSTVDVKAEDKKEEKTKEKIERKESKGKKEYKEKKELKKDNKNKKGKK
jgi:hypothetical protein